MISVTTLLTDLKNICKAQYKDRSSEIYLNLLGEIVRVGCKNSLISYDLLDIFPFLGEIYASDKITTTGLEISLLHLTNVLCLQLAIEFRYRICAFVEEICQYVIKLHDSKRDNKNPYIYHFLITALNVHHPDGVHQLDKTAYAHDWPRWKGQINDIFVLCNEETKRLLKNPNKIEPEEGFLDLLVDVTNLVCECFMIYRAALVDINCR